MNQHFFTGSLLLEQGRLGLAVEEFQKAVLLEPEDSRTHAHLAVAMVRSGRAREALKTAVTALEKDPNDEYAHWTMALVRAERNELKAAESYIRPPSQRSPPPFSC